MSESEIPFSREHEQRVHRAVCKMLSQAVEDPAAVAAALPSELAQTQVEGAFVTLKCEGKLRSCYGCYGGPYVLATALEQASLGAATKDPRFPTLGGDELPRMHVEISLLYNIRLIADKGLAGCETIEVGRHGLMIRAPAHAGLLLPRVAMDFQLDARQFLAQVCVKAGLPPQSWLDDESELHTFEAYCFGGMYVDGGGTA